MQSRLAFFHLLQNGRELGILGLFDVQNVLKEPTILRVLVVPPIDFVDVHHVDPQIVELEWQALLASLHRFPIEAANLGKWPQELSWRQASMLPQKVREFRTGNNSTYRRVFLSKPASKLLNSLIIFG